MASRAARQRHTNDHASNQSGDQPGAPSATRSETLHDNINAIRNAEIPLDAIAPHPRNYNQHSEQQLARLRASERRWGQVRSVVVQEGAPGRYLAVAGHGYMEARRAEGSATVRADIIPASWSAEQVEGYLVADNELARLSEPDAALLADLLQDQQRAGIDLLTMGVDESMLEDLLAATEAPPTLDELAREYGHEPNADAFWASVSLKVPGVVKQQFDSLMRQVGVSSLALGAPDSEATRFAALLACVDLAAVGALSPEVVAALTGADGEMDAELDVDNDDQ